MPNRAAVSAPGFVGLLLGIIAVCSVAVAGAAFAQQKRQVPPSREVVQYSFAPIARKASPAAVPNPAPAGGK